MNICQRLFFVFLFLFPAGALAETGNSPVISSFWAIPFILMLLSVAFLPLTFHHYWEKNEIKVLTSVLLSASVIYYFLTSVEGGAALLGHSVHEYLSFIVLISALFIISGGLFLDCRFAPTPFYNTIFMAAGGILASFVGTTGASLIFIRPLLRANKLRNHLVHTVIFFIFVVGNCGGCLTPLGDPPLFMGYLAGVPFSWTFKLWPEWLLVNASLLTIYFFTDLYLARREPSIEGSYRLSSKVTLGGVHNLLFLGLLVVTVALVSESPRRELILCGLSLVSFITTSPTIREKNGFKWEPVIEVASVFLGLFITLCPVLLILKTSGPNFGITSEQGYFWITGLLSSFLDNAPTYIVSFNLAKSLGAPGTLVAGVPETLLAAISLGSVFFGSFTYIGNAPNFLIRAIAEGDGIKMPSFFGFMKWSLLSLLPPLAAVSIIFM